MSEWKAVEGQLRDEGWCVIPDVLSPKEQGDARERLWAIVEANRRNGIATTVPGVDPNENNIRVFTCWRPTPFFVT